MISMFLVVVLCLAFGACSGELQTNVSDTQQEIESVVSQEIIEESEMQDETVDYGDRLTISCDITEQSIIWEDAGETVFQVATTSEQFQNEFDLSEETMMRMVML